MEEKINKVEEERYRTVLDNNLWTTKGSRFAAHVRLMKRARISNITVGILSSYLIIFGLLSVYNIVNVTKIDPNFLAFGSTAVSILVLLFGQIESTNDYKLRALQHHACALKIAKLHRMIKNYKSEDGSNESDFCKVITKKYDRILESFDNHKTSDYNKFRAFHEEFFKINKCEKFFYIIVFYVDIYWLYTLLISIPLLGFYYLFK